MNRNRCLTLVVILSFAASLAAPAMVQLVQSPGRMAQPASYEIEPVVDVALNSLDTAGGEDGWSPLYRVMSGAVLWDQTWPNGYRHENLLAATPYGGGTQLKGDSNSVALSTDAKGFYQYLRISLSPNITSYSLHLDFWLREDSSSTVSTVDNWAVYIFGSKVSTWSGALWSYSEPDCNEHGEFMQQVFDIPLTDPEVFVVIGHGDGWSSDYMQGHTKFLNEITANQIVTREEVLVSEDCFVSQAFPNSNFNNLSLAVGMPVGFQVSAYLKFSLLGIMDVKTARLELYCYDEAAFSDLIICSGTEGNNWDESTLTWSNRPSSTLQELNRSEDVAWTWQSWDVTDWIQTHENLTDVTLVLSCDDSGTSCANYWSKDESIFNDENHRPRLIVEGYYVVTPCETVELVRSLMIADFVLYDPPGQDSYQSLKKSSSYNWQVSMGFEASMSLGGKGAGFSLDVDYSHSWGFSQAFVDSFTSSRDPQLTGVDGDTLVGRVLNVTIQIEIYRRVGADWEYTHPGKTVTLDSVGWIDYAVVTRSEAKSGALPFIVPDFPDRHRELSPHNLKYYAGGGSPLDISVVREYHSGSSLTFKAGYYQEYKSGDLEFDLELLYTMKRDVTDDTRVETEFVLSDPVGTSCYACSESALEIDWSAYNSLNTQGYLFWFYY